MNDRSVLPELSPVHNGNWATRLTALKLRSVAFATLGTPSMPYEIRSARHNERPELEALIARSIRTLGASDYSAVQIEAALRGAFGVDSQLIKDGTYFVVCDEALIVGCGGWGMRRTLFGGDAHTARDAGVLDPSRDAAKIRAFFVDPQHARRGVGRMLLDHCEVAARRAGFSRFELMATLPGVRLYQSLGYRAQPAVQYALGSGLTIEFVPMHKP